MAEKKIGPLIIVGIDNTGENRIREYIPYRSTDPPVPRPLGARYPEFLQRDIMPLVEKNYRVGAGPEYTGLGGSSLGGLIAWRYAAAHQDELVRFIRAYVVATDWTLDPANREAALALHRDAWNVTREAAETEHDTGMLQGAVGVPEIRAHDARVVFEQR